MKATNSKSPALSSQAKSALNVALDELLSQLNILNETPDLFNGYRAMDDFTKALAKHDPWRLHIRLFDLFDILGLFVRRYGIKGKEIKLVDALSAARFQAFRNDVRDYLLSIPRHYQLTVDLPSMPSWGSGEVRLTERLVLVEGKKAENNQRLSDLLSGRTGPVAAVRARVDGFGFGSRASDTTAALDAISHLKQFFHLFRRTDVYKSESSSLALATGEQKLWCDLADVDWPDETASFQAPASLGRFLAMVGVDEQKLQHFEPSGRTLLGGELRPAKTRDEKAAALIEKTGWITKLMNCSTEWPDAERIRTAVEWSFDSAQNENETFAFLQACIGLEALIGDDSKEEPLTARLADRCAYLLGTSHKDREGIRSRFKRMYDVRSKVIHGRSPRLSLPDAEELHFAQSVLGDVITKEATLLLKALAEREKRK